MGFAFIRQRNIGKQVRAIAGEQIDKALAECEATDKSLDETVHGLRRRCKKMRGLLRLIEPHFKDFALENRAFRDAADGLAGARDSAVMVETFQALLAKDSQRGGKARLDAEQAGRVLRRLQERLGEAAGSGEGRDLLMAFAGLMRAARKRVEDWSIRGSGFSRIGDGLETTYRQMREGMQAAMEDVTAEALHDWRKDTKYHWHHVSLFEGCAPELLAGRKTLLDDLGELLGDHHNLVVLDETLSGERGLAGSDIMAVQKLIVERQAELAERAFALGRQLTAEKPATLRRRFEDYWVLLPVEK